MSSTPTPSPGTTLLKYRLVDRLGASVWKAEDTSSGKTVAVKFLTRQLPKDVARRDTLVRQIRLGSALFNSFLVPIQEIAPAGEMLLMVMDFLDAQPLTKHLNGSPATRDDFFRIAYQIGEGLRFLHSKNVIHGNLNGDSILVGVDGHVRLGGLNVSNVLQRGEGPTAYQMKGNDPRSVGYMAPEQITAQAVDSRTDIFSLGVAMYEMATGKHPFAANSAADMARQVVEGNPPSPKALNPAVDNQVLTVMAPCLFKDTFKRQKDAKTVLESIARFAPEAARFATRLSTTAVPASSTNAGSGDGRQVLLLIADIAGLPELTKRDAAAAARATARMQQVLGEAAFLFDGKIVDPFGSRLIAEMPSVEAALEAARKGEFDFSTEQQDGEPLNVRLLLHAGEVFTRDGAVTGDAVDKAQEILDQSTPRKLQLSEEFMKKARGTANLRVRDAGAKAGVKMFAIVPAEPPPEPEISTAELEEQEAAEVAAEVQAMAGSKAVKKKRGLMAAAAAVVAIVLGVAVVFLMPKKEEAPVAPQAASSPKLRDSAPTAANPKRVVLEPFVVEGNDPALTERVNVIRLASIEMLRAFPELRIADGPGSDVASFSARVHAGAAGPEIVAVNAGQDINGSSPLADAASGLRTIVQGVSSALKVPVPTASASTEALNAFADAIGAVAARDDAKAEPLIRASVAADPNFLPAQLLAMRFFTEKGKSPDALAAMRQVVALDGSNLEVTRNLARATLDAGDVREAFATYNKLLKANSSDPEVLGLVGRYSAAIGDTQRFAAVVARLRSLPPNLVPVHEPDILVLNGRMENAIDRYYDIETNAPNNPSLALKIGRVSVIRRAMPIAELELKKLQTSDAGYGYPLLKAYMAAQANDRTTAVAQLKLAEGGSTPGDDYWTSVAEIHAMLADGPAAMDALERAAARKEPTVNYILRNPLFTYLESEDRFQKIRESLTGQIEEIRTALGQVAL